MQTHTQKNQTLNLNELLSFKLSELCIQYLLSCTPPTLLSLLTLAWIYILHDPIRFTIRQCVQHHSKDAISIPGSTSCTSPARAAEHHTCMLLSPYWSQTSSCHSALCSYDKDHLLELMQLEGYPGIQMDTHTQADTDKHTHIHSLNAHRSIALSPDGVSLSIKSIWVWTSGYDVLGALISVNSVHSVSKLKMKSAIPEQFGSVFYPSVLASLNGSIMLLVSLR